MILKDVRLPEALRWPGADLSALQRRFLGQRIACLRTQTASRDLLGELRRPRLRSELVCVGFAIRSGSSGNLVDHGLDDRCRPFDGDRISRVRRVIGAAPLRNHVVFAPCFAGDLDRAPNAGHSIVCPHRPNPQRISGGTPK